MSENKTTIKCKRDDSISIDATHALLDEVEENNIIEGEVLPIIWVDERVGNEGTTPYIDGNVLNPVNSQKVAMEIAKRINSKHFIIKHCRGAWEKRV